MAIEKISIEISKTELQQLGFKLAAIMNEYRTSPHLWERCFWLRSYKLLKRLENKIRNAKPKQKLTLALDEALMIAEFEDLHPLMRTLGMRVMDAWTQLGGLNDILDGENRTVFLIN